MLSDSSDHVTSYVKCKRALEYRPKPPAKVALFLGKASSYNFDDVLNCECVQQCSNYFYDVLNNMLNDSFPMRKCTISSCDPSFMTPEIKSLLRKKNKLMHRNNVEKASAIAVKVGKLIARKNSTSLSTINVGTSNIWGKFKNLLGRVNPLQSLHQ